MDGDDGFEGAAELAGDYLAHAVCVIQHGETLVPLVGHGRVVTAEGERAFALLQFGGLELRDALRNAEQWLETNPQGVARAVLLHDRFLTWLGARRDALFCTARRHRTLRPGAR
jgi:hypothetical protein